MIKITQVRDGGNHVTQSTLTLDAWVERMKEEVKTYPVTMFRSQLRHFLPGDHCEAADKLPKMMPAAEFRKTEGGQCMKAYNGLVELTVGPLAGRAEVEQVKREAWKLPQTRCAFMGASGHSVKILVAFTRPDNTLPLARAEAEAFHAHAYIMAVKCYQPQLSFDIRPKEPFLEQYSRLSYDPDVLYRPDSVQFYLSQPMGMPDEMALHTEPAVSGQRPLERALGSYETADALSMLFEAALRQAYIDLDKPDPADEKSSYSWDTLLSQLALNCFRSGIPEEAVVSRARFRHFARKPLELVRQVVRNVYSRRQDFGSKCALSREQQLSVLIAEFMKRRYEFRFNVQTGEAEFRERHSFCFRFQPVDKRALNSIALDAQAEGIPLWDRDISRYVYSNRVPVYNPLEDFLFNLPEWDGRDRIRLLAQTVPCNNPHWPELFHRIGGGWTSAMPTVFRPCWWERRERASPPFAAASCRLPNVPTIRTASISHARKMSN